MNCKSFKDQIFLFQTDELSGQDREACQRHLDACEACAARLRFEDSLLRVVKAKLPRTAAPPGLETRIRAALREQAAPEIRVPWYRSPWFAAAAAAVLLVVVLVPSLIVDLPPGGDGSGVPVQEAVTVVDLDCDQAGRSLSDQRGCLHPHHINALRLADGSYWAISSEEADFRYLLLDREVRGQQLVVQGRLYPDSHTVRLTAVESLDARVSPSLPVAVLPWPVLI